MLALFLVPFIIVLLLVFAMPSAYGGTFVGELSEKFDRLSSIDKPKIVIVSGSSAAFGIDSEMIESELDFKVVNFGLYANLGTKLMMDLSKSGISDGDIIILAPEMNSETLSLYFNPQTTAQALDGSFYMARWIDPDNYESMIGASWSLAANKLYYALSEKSPENTGAYKKENFNEYGDNIYNRPYNILAGFGNPIYLNFFTDYGDGVYTEYEEYIDYVNDYVKYADKKGAKVYFSFPPMNEQAVEQNNTKSSIDEFYKNLCLSLDCKVISNIYDYILDDGYFYDSEFHLNNSGVVVRTVRLIDDIKRELMRDDITVPADELPEPPGHRPDCKELELLKTDDGEEWVVVALSEDGMLEKDIVIPDEVNGLPVSAIMRGSFAGCENLVTLTLGANIRYIEQGAVENSPKLTGIIIPEGIKPYDIMIPQSGLGKGCSDDFRIYVSENDIDDYINSGDEDFEGYLDIIAVNQGFIYSAESGYAAAESLTESGKQRSSLKISDSYSGLPVTKILSGALDGTDSLNELILGENIRIIESGALKGASGKLKIILPAGVLPQDFELPENPDELGFDGELEISVDSSLYDEYLASENLSAYADIITTDNPYLLLEQNENGWTVVGVNYRGTELKELVIPDTVSGIAVTTIAQDAFRDTMIEKLTLGREIKRLDGGALGGSNILKVIIPDGMGAQDISVPNNMSERLATDGCRNGLRIYVDKNLYSEFASDYFWGDYGRYLEENPES